MSFFAVSFISTALDIKKQNLSKLQILIKLFVVVLKLPWDILSRLVDQKASSGDAASKIILQTSQFDLHKDSFVEKSQNV